MSDGSLTRPTKGRRPSSTAPQRRIKKKTKRRRKGVEGFLLSITLQLILFASGVDLKDSSVADVSKILPLIIVAQCYLLLKMV